VVDGGAEKVCEPRLPKLPPRPARASASVIAKANTAATAQSASSGRTRKESMEILPERPVWSPQILVSHGGIVRGAAWCRRPARAPWQHPLRGVLHFVCEPKGTRIRMMDQIPACPGMSAGRDLVVFPVLAGLGHR